MKPLSHWAIALCLGFCLMSFNEAPSIPEIDLQTEADFRLYQEDVFIILDWLIESPIDYSSEERRKANLFLMDWVNGAPYVSVKPHGAILQYTYENPALLPIFMGAKARFQVKNPDKHPFIDGAVAGIDAILEVYKRGEGVQKVEKLEQLLDLQMKGELRAWASDIWKSMGNQKMYTLSY